MARTQKHNRGRWKAVERFFGRDLGGDRVPVTGRQGENRTSTDLTSSYPLWVDVKSRLECPVTLWKWMRNIIDNAPEGMIPALILHRPRMKYEEAVVALPYPQFKQLMERAYGNEHTRGTKPDPG